MCPVILKFDWSLGELAKMQIMVQWVQGPRFFISNNLQMIPQFEWQGLRLPHPSHIFAVCPCPPCYCWFTQHKHLTQNKLIRTLLRDFFELELGKMIIISLAAKLCILRLGTSLCPFFLLKGESCSGMMRPAEQEMDKNLATFISLVSPIPIEPEL